MTDPSASTQRIFDRMTVAINQNPDGFRKSATGKRRFARGEPYVSPYEHLAAEVYGEPIEPDASRGRAKRKAWAVFVASFGNKPQPTKYLNSAARRRENPKSAPREMTGFPVAA